MLQVADGSHTLTKVDYRDPAAATNPSDTASEPPAAATQSSTSKVPLIIYWSLSSCVAHIPQPDADRALVPCANECANAVLTVDLHVLHPSATLDSRYTDPLTLTHRSHSHAISEMNSQDLFVAFNCIVGEYSFSSNTSLSLTLTHSHTLLITCTCCYDLTKGTQDKDFSYTETCCPFSSPIQRVFVFLTESPFRLSRNWTNWQPNWHSSVTRLNWRPSSTKWWLSWLSSRKWSRKSLELLKVQPRRRQLIVNYDILIGNGIP